ncbi:hypothetical protein V493_00372 [Pseudogymnoascus sp. VKM F-4281 (FW-2241)]|nr:hypothetical protein V493_00372 [Pseudogymnoascus sp. VKM F-4281 (FW-2241)]
MEAPPGQLDLIHRAARILLTKTLVSHKIPHWVHNLSSKKDPDNQRRRGAERRQAIIRYNFASSFDTASVTMAPEIQGFTRHWASDFQGNSGSLPDDNRWDIVNRGPNYGNKEIQNFIKDTSVVCQDGEQLIICPSYDDKKWTSARLHCKKDFHASDNRIMIIQAHIKVSVAAENLVSGVWPSFWLLGKSYREGGDASWPDCGEIDIFENAAGKPYSIPALHFGEQDNLKSKIGHKADFNRDEWHTWAIRIDRKSSNGNWEDEEIQFLLDGKQYFKVTGQDVGDRNRWESLAHQPVFPILQVAVGTNWDGGSQPTDATRHMGQYYSLKKGSRLAVMGLGLMVTYVAVYFDER